MIKIETQKRKKLTSIFDFWDSTRSLQFADDDELIELLEFLNGYTVLRDPQFTVFRTDNELMDIIEMLILAFYENKLSDVKDEKIYKDCIKKDCYITKQFLIKKSIIVKQ